MIKLKKKLIGVLILLLMIFSSFVVSSRIEAITENSSEINEVRIAILFEEPIRGWGSGKILFVAALENYQWTVGEKTYKFTLTEIYDKDIVRGKLNTENFDALLVPGGGVGDGESLVKGFKHLPRIKRWKNEIVSFVEDGGGYNGYCGGVGLMSHFDRTPESLVEWQYERSTLGASCVKIFLPDTAADRSNPGSTAYMWGYQEPLDYECVEDFVNLRSGIPLDTQIMKDNPIFDDFSEDSSPVSWISSPALVVPNDPDREVTILARYPVEEVSENESTMIHEWRYTGGIRGYIRGFLEGIKLCRELKEPLINAVSYTGFFAKDWERTDKVVELNYSNRPCMTSEIYPNENEGRIVLSGPHPEYPVWFGGRIQEREDTDDNCIINGHYTWVDIIPSEETPEDEMSHTWWMVRRQIAWAAKVPDNDLPPVYGPSQVCDFEQNITTSDFTVYGNSETADGIASLDLYYRYSNDTVNWTEWTLFNTDNDKSDGWSWEFNSPEVPAYYQFYSIRNVIYEGTTEHEIAPPGPDAIVKVV